MRALTDSSRRSRPAAPSSPRHVLLIVALSAVAAGCSAGPGAATPRSTAAAQQLSGTWDVLLLLDPHSTMRPPAVASVAGTVALIVDHRGLHDTDALRDVTHVGVYDVDFGAFGWGTDDRSTPATALARVAALEVHGTHVDSVHVELSPGSAVLMVRLSGTLRGDSVSGRWEAEAFRAGGGSGRFVMRRPHSSTNIIR
jgi:hypothetical protein